jgi:hypothetical protein
MSVHNILGEEGINIVNKDSLLGYVLLLLREVTQLKLIVWNFDVFSLSH